MAETWITGRFCASRVLVVERLEDALGENVPELLLATFSMIRPEQEAKPLL